MSTARIFALDIGTREIAGLLMSPTDEGFAIMHASTHRQLPGAMADGQIHRIDAVAQVIAKIKDELEQAEGVTLEKAAVAAAGRSLITEIGVSTVTSALNQRFSAAGIKSLELEAVWNAVKKLSANGGKGAMDSYLCVGYSVTQRYLDGEPIGSLIDHRGREGKVEVIATFLPRIVIDSLSTALESAGLSMDSLTLEPIAAMHLVVPATMRMLNIALVDVGAGTSDLAISAEGTIKDYGMVSHAGDAITAGIAEQFLLDTKVAERVKTELRPDRTYECEDVFGNTLTISYRQLLETIQPHVQVLADKIARKILELNGGAPKGVILIGGGSLTPGLAETLAQSLSLPSTLVRVRNRSSLENIVGVPDFHGPQTITPMAIGVTHLDGRGMQLIRVSVNEQQLQVLKMASSTVGDSLLYAGIVPGEFAGRPGRAYTVELNGRCIPLPGTLGRPAAILKNGKAAGLDTPLRDGDQITVLRGKAGEPPGVTLEELTDISAHSFRFTLNGSAIEVKPQILVNGEVRPPDYIVRDRDKIALGPITDFAGLFEYLRIPIEQEIRFYLNNEPKTALERLRILVDGVEQSLRAHLRNGAKVEYERPGCSLREVLGPPEEEASENIAVLINGEEFELAPKLTNPTVNGKTVTLDYKIRPLDRIKYVPSPAGALNSYIVTDIFRNYEPDAEFLRQGGTILLNGKEVGFTAPIKHGDVLKLVPYGADTANS